MWIYKYSIESLTKTKWQYPLVCTNEKMKKISGMVNSCCQLMVSMWLFFCYLPALVALPPPPPALVALPATATSTCRIAASLITLRYSLLCNADCEERGNQCCWNNHPTYRHCNQLCFFIHQYPKCYYWILLLSYMLFWNVICNIRILALDFCTWDI